MNLIQLQQKFNTHLKCVKHLENVRWGNTPICPYCDSDNIYVRGKKRKFKKNRTEHLYKTPRYFCNDCRRDFTVLTGTIFEASKMPLNKWFTLIALMLNARKGISAMNLMRDLDVTYKTAWFAAMRVRCAMLDQAGLLEGVVEMDESYFGGKPRHRNTPDNVANLGANEFHTDDWKVDRRKFNKGRGTDKVKVVGIVERGKDKGKVALKVQDSLTGADLLRMLKQYVNTKKATVMTDDFRAYNAFDKVIQHYTVNHSNKEYVKHIKGIKDAIHTNTIEGVWSIIKNGIRGQYHVLSKKYLPFYLAEAAYKYNRRGKKEAAGAFDETIENAVTDEKCEVNYKPKGNVEKIVYREDVRKKNPKKCKPARRKHIKKKKTNSKKSNTKKSSKKSQKKKAAKK